MKPAIYLDPSAIVKLVIAEAESRALTRHLRDRPKRVSCALARVEVIRAVRPHGAPAIARAGRLLARISLLRLDDVLLDAAAARAQRNELADGNAVARHDKRLAPVEGPHDVAASRAR